MPSEPLGGDRKREPFWTRRAHPQRARASSRRQNAGQRRQDHLDHRHGEHHGRRAAAVSEPVERSPRLPEQETRDDQGQGAQLDPEAQVELGPTPARQPALKVPERDLGRVAGTGHGGHRFYP